ncbi:hypothetical protein APUTEX25_000905, partial [Auxenochlorella protothecoides]
VRKRRRQEEDVKPWCFYCDREFQDEATLITHQKSKHFKCETCHKRLVTVRALAVHSLQVHKHPVTAVPDALPGRESLEFDVFGMSGVPAGMLARRPHPRAPAPAEAAPDPGVGGYGPPSLAPPGMAPPVGRAAGGPLPAYG